MIEKYSVSMSGMQVTLAIIVINIVIFIALNTITELSTELILYPELDMVLQRPWTLVTVFFSHEGIIHILGNMSLLLFFGARLEKITSSKNVLLIYLISGFVGSLTILSTAPLIGWEETVRGASAAVFCDTVHCQCRHCATLSHGASTRDRPAQSQSAWAAVCGAHFYADGARGKRSRKDSGGRFDVEDYLRRLRGGHQGDY